MRTFIIDTDTASDDAVAILMALAAPEVKVAALTTVAGNVALEQATRNALYTAEIAGSNVPVYPGAAAPLARAHEDAHWFHGRDGLGDHDYPAPKRAPESEYAVRRAHPSCPGRARSDAGHARPANQYRARAGEGPGLCRQNRADAS